MPQSTPKLRLVENETYLTKEDMGKIGKFNEKQLRGAIGMLDANYQNLNNDFVIELREELEEALKKFVITIYPNEEYQAIPQAPCLKIVK